MLLLLADTVFRTVLSLYMQDTALPLPTFEEVLLCNEKTTSEEVLQVFILDFKHAECHEQVPRGTYNSSLSLVGGCLLNGTVSLQYKRPDVTNSSAYIVIRSHMHGMY